MIRPISILHISDLHKSSDERYDNLLQSLKDDCDRYTTEEGIQKPNIIVVSGDLINGGTPEEIENQYRETSAFLDKLVEYFLQGDKTRIIIVPGNHDVDWNSSREAVKELPVLSPNSEKLKSVITEFFQKEESIYRWSWETLKFNVVDDTSLYKKRFSKFANFYREFYNDERHYSIEPSEQYDIFDIPDLGVTFFGFNSAFATDHLRDTGKIFPDCLTTLSEAIKDFDRKGRLLISVWHHNTSGRPIQSDYMDGRILQKMLSYNIHIGLHGHQHSCEIISMLNNPFEKKKMLMISAGTLYGKADALPPGTTRQYNIIEIKPDDGYVTVRVHSRENIDKDLYSCPEWRRGRIDRIGEPEWSERIDMKNSINVDLNEIITRAEKSGDYKTAIAKLRCLDANTVGVRKILVHFLAKIQDYIGVMQCIQEPQTSEEALRFMEAALEINTKDAFDKVRGSVFIHSSTDPSINKMRSYFNGR